MSPLKKVLMTLMILGAMSTTLGAGTFASFNANTTSGASTFATGTVVLSDRNEGTATTCYSTSGGTTDSNSAHCAALFTSAASGLDDGKGDNAWLRRPGEVATVDITLRNEGSLSGTLGASMPSACDYINDVNANYNGTSIALCQNLQFSLQEYTTATNRTNNVTTGGTCLYGPGKLPFLTSSVITFPKTFTSTNNKFRLTVNGTAFTNDVAGNAAIAVGQYATIGALAAAVQNAARAVNSPAGVGAGIVVVATPDNRLTVMNPLPGAGNGSIGTNNASTQNGLATLGWTDATTNSGAGTACTLGASAGVWNDSRQTLGTFFGSYPSSTPLALGGLAVNGSRYYRLTLMLPYGADTELQGKLAQFSMSWTLIQS